MADTKVYDAKEVHLSVDNRIISTFQEAHR